MPQEPIEFAREFRQNIAHTLLAAEHCLEQRQQMPALILMYSLMDSLAWASFGPSATAGVGERFESWATQWLLPYLGASYPEISARDLYAARCAVLHTMTGDSDLSRKGKAKRVMYAWGTADVEVLRRLIRGRLEATHVPLHYDGLLSSLMWAAAVFLEEASRDPSLSQRVLAASARHYVNVEVKDGGI